MSSIELQEVTKQYPGVLPVLENISFRIEKGEFYYLTGVSGAGKTTIFRMLMMIERPTSGRILFGNSDITRLPTKQQALHRRKIGMVFQDYRLLEGDTIQDNVALPLRVAGLSGRRLREQVDRRLQEVGLYGRHKERVKGLSGGEKQLVSIARALAFNPRVFFADEPTGNLDQTMAFRVMDLIHGLNRKGCTTIVATHDLNLIRTYKARTLLIKDKTVHEVRLAEK